MKDHSDPPAELKSQFQCLNELKTNVEIMKIDEKSTERIRRKFQLQSLSDRIYQASQDKDSVSAKLSNSPFMLPKNKSGKSSNNAAKETVTKSKKQNIFSLGFSKLLGKTTEKQIPKSCEVLESDLDIESARSGENKSDIQAYNINIINNVSLEKVSQDPLTTTVSSKVDDIREEVVEVPINNILSEAPVREPAKERDGLPLAESQFSKSLLMLEKQVEALNHTNSKAVNIDYLAEFKARNNERVAKLSTATPNSDRTLSGSSSSLLQDQSSNIQ